ncbi:MAG: carotenoid 1,2-hydratase [Polyangiaceae bacterium]
MSDDGRRGLTLILMIGSVFSPFYRKAISRGKGDPEKHAAVNLALYNLASPGGSWLGPAIGRKTGDLWALTEGARVSRETSILIIGGTRAEWRDGQLHVDLCEETAPFASPLRGELVVRPNAPMNEVHDLDPAGRHRWSPIAPFGRIDVRFREPGLSWSGPAYLDHNAGDEPLARGFRCWTWSRVTSSEKTTVVYDVTCRDGQERRLARSFLANGARETCAGETRTLQLPTTGWRMPRSVRTVGDASLTVAHTMEDTPFYARSHLTGHLDGKPADGVHEVVDMDRFESRTVQAMLPYRMRKLTP